MNIRTFTFNLFQEHTMVAWKDGRNDCIIVDPGFYTGDERTCFFSFLSEEGLTPSAILLTHAHADHIFGAKATQDAFGGIPVHMDDKELLNLSSSTSLAGKLGLKTPECDFKISFVKDGDVISEAGMNFKVICTPGHSPGGVCYLEEEEKVLFTGDTLFAGTIGRTDLLYSEYDDEIRSIMEKLIVLPVDIEIHPGHGPSSTIGRERTHNPFLEPFNEPEEELGPDAEPIILTSN